jgi:hypothetical protein
MEHNALTLSRKVDECKPLIMGRVLARDPSLLATMSIDTKANPWPGGNMAAAAGKVGRCRMTVSKSVMKAPMVSALDAKYDELLSDFAFKLNLRHCSKGGLSPVGPVRNCAPRRRLPFHFKKRGFRMRVTITTLWAISGRP